MNPLTNMKNVKKLSEQELVANNKTSWHDQYRDSAWLFVGGLPFDLTEGDIICIFSQYGEVVNINLVRTKDTGKSRGFCFICYEDQRSTDLAVDNFNGIKILNRTIRVDHVNDYKVPKDSKKTDKETKKLYEEGCAPKPIDVNKMLVLPPPPEDVRETLADQIVDGVKLPPRLPIYPIKEEPGVDKKVKLKKEKKSKKEKKCKKKSSKKKRKRRASSSDDSSSSSSGSSSGDSSDEESSCEGSKDNKQRSRKKNHGESEDEEEKYSKQMHRREHTEVAKKKYDDKSQGKFEDRRREKWERRNEKYDDKRIDKYDNKRQERYDGRKHERYEDRKYDDRRFEKYGERREEKYNERRQDKYDYKR